MVKAKSQERDLSNALLERIDRVRAEILELHTQLRIEEGHLASLLEVSQIIPANNGQRPGAERRGIRRGFRVALYTATAKATTASALSEHRRKVLDAVINAHGGVRAKQIIKVSGLPHDSVQRALSWLRENGLVEAEEDSQARTP